MRTMQSSYWPKKAKAPRKDVAHGRPSKKHITKHFVPEHIQPILDYWKDCTCDLESIDSSDGSHEDCHALDIAQANGTAVWIEYEDGAVVAHLPSCQKYRVKPYFSSNPRTLASDIVRARGITYSGQERIIE